MSGMDNFNDGQIKAELQRALGRASQAYRGLHLSETQELQASLAAAAERADQAEAKIRGALGEEMIMGLSPVERLEYVYDILKGKRAARPRL